MMHGAYVKYTQPLSGSQQKGSMKQGSSITEGIGKGVLIYYP